MRLIWVVIPLVLIGIIGMQESFADEGWYPSKNLQEKTYLHYEICQYEDNQCNLTTMYYWVKQGNNPKMWHMETTIIDDRKETRGTIMVDKDTNELRVYNSTIFQDYRNILHNSIGLFSNSITKDNPNRFYDGGDWFSQPKSNLNSTTFQISKSDLIIPFNNATNYSLIKFGGELKDNGAIWVNEEIPFPVKANYTISNLDKVEKIEFELVNYEKSIHAPDFLNYKSKPGDYLEFNTGTRIMKILSPSGSLPLPEPIGPTNGIWIYVSPEISQTVLAYTVDNDEFSNSIPTNTPFTIMFDETKVISDVHIDRSNQFWGGMKGHIEIQYLAPGQTVTQKESTPIHISSIGNIQWLEASYPTSGAGIVRIVEPDMNLHPESIDNFIVTVWSDSDVEGIELTVNETGKGTGVFEGSVFFTTAYASSGHVLKVKNGDTITAKYVDSTLPDPYLITDELEITSSTLSGTISPIFRSTFPSNLRTIDAFGNSLDSVSIDQQVRISADLANGNDVEQPFTYLVQIQDGNGVTVSLAWITGSLSSGQSFSPAISWIPTEAGTYTATAFYWISVDNPTALSPPVSTTIRVK